MRWTVQQALCRTRTIEVEAPTKAEALRLARVGYGDVVSYPRTPRLLIESAAKSDQRDQERPS